MEENEQLEKELTFLKESFESDIISAEEYKKRKEAIEKKLTDIEEKGTKEAEQEEKKEDIEKKEEIQEIKKEEHEEKAEEEETKDAKEEIKIEEIKQEKLKQAEEEKQEIEEKEEEQKELKSEEETEESEKEETQEVKEEEIEELQEKPKKKRTKLIIFSILIVIVFLIFYFYAFKATNEEKEDHIEEGISALQPACISDEDCETPDKTGTCLNPGTSEAACEFIEDKETSLTIINDENCISCDTARMFQIIKQLFPLVKTTEINSNSEEGRKLISQFGLEALPSYIFESDIQNTLNFEKFKRALVENADKFIINPAASGSNYYFKRKRISNKLDLFVLPTTSSGVEDNLGDVLELFEDNIDYSKHIISDEGEEKNLYKELGITTYPSFLVNNQLKFTGIQSPELIKNKFCELNQLSGCEIQLSTSLK